MDIDSVPLGIDFVEHVTEQIGKCSAVIVMIVKQWHTIKDKKRRRRLDNEDDLNERAECRNSSSRGSARQNPPPRATQWHRLPPRLMARGGSSVAQGIKSGDGARAEVLAAAIMESSSGAVLYPFSQKVIPPHTKHTSPASHCDGTGATRVACSRVMTSADAFAELADLLL